MSPSMAATKKTRAKKNEELVIPDKLYFRIGEVAKLLALPAYVLRFWETEFPQLKPTKSNTGQRMYRRREVELAIRVKKLLYEEGFTIAGARERLKADAKPAKAQSGLPFPKAASSDGLREVKRGLTEILNILSSKNGHKVRAKP
jgi:DNA-binding transcriptional MerR regulator